MGGGVGAGRRDRSRGNRVAVQLMARALRLAVAVAFLPIAMPIAAASRLGRRRVDVGLGPEPLINNIHHKKALATCGYSAETYVDHVYYVTEDFDYRADLVLPKPLFFLRAYLLFLRALFRYRCLYIYFNGGPLGAQPLLWRLEPWLYRTAGQCIVVMPYGSDVQDMTRSQNLQFRAAMAKDYPEQGARRPRIAAQVDMWCRHADWVLSGVDWVDYMPHWDTLTLGHFSIDTDAWQPPEQRVRSGTPLSVLHAPNHAAIKGTDHFVQAVEQLNAEGIPIELTLLERVSNERVREAMESVDIVADQLIVGWYAMFAIEAMAMGKPVLCYLREDLLALYRSCGLLGRDEPPIVNCTPETILEQLRAVAEDSDAYLANARSAGPRYVAKNHSLEAVGRLFNEVNRAVGVQPSGRPREE